VRPVFSLVQAVFGVPELILCPLRISPVAVRLQ
jgi:hypothetical protein